MTQIEADLPALRRISLLELSVPSDPKAGVRALAWMAGQADQVIWCTQAFTPAERAVWATVPDALKDRAVLLGTRADRTDAAALDVLHAAAGEDFAFVQTLSAQRAQAARSVAGTDRDAFRAAGGAALMTRIMSDLKIRDAGLRDQAEVFLRREGIPIVSVPEDEVLSLEPQKSAHTPAPPRATPKDDRPGEIVTLRPTAFTAPAEE